MNKANGKVYTNRMIALLLAFSLLCCFSLPVFAAEPANVTYEDLGNGFAVKTTLIHEAGNSRTTAADTKVKEYTYNGTWIATVTLNASFSYNGSTVSVTNAYATRSLASGWIYYNESLTKSGGTASLSASLTRNGCGTVPVALSLTCDKNGNIS